MNTKSVTRDVMVVALAVVIGKIAYEIVKLPLEIAIIKPFKVIFGWTFTKVRDALREKPKAAEPKPEGNPEEKAEGKPKEPAKSSDKKS